MFGHVMHRRAFPRENRFTYGIYYISLHLDDLAAVENNALFAVNAPALLSFYSRDHGARDGGDLRAWIDDILIRHDVRGISSIEIICMPRVLGYVFNPVTFWICRDANGATRAVLCEVNNTFGQTHSYLCLPPEGKGAIDSGEWIEAEKVFHVSPFLPREGAYSFRFDIQDEICGIWIDYHAADGRKQVFTALTGRFEPMTRAALVRAFFAYPLVTFKAIALIHWQAVKLFIKRQRFYKKPLQFEIKLSVTGVKITKT
jgi:hypothetical protein